MLIEILLSVSVRWVPVFFLHSRAACQIVAHSAIEIRTSLHHINEVSIHSLSSTFYYAYNEEYWIQ